MKTMEQPSEKTYHMSIQDIKNNPELIAELFLKDQDVSLIFEKRGDKVRYAYLKSYKKESIKILKEAKEEHKRYKSKGYTHDQAFKDLEEARKEINKHL